jgi:L-phenylalanine/L-methionine N-acetyltransferase
MPNDPLSAKPAPVIIRALEPSDWQEYADLMALPKVRWGTLRLPFASSEQWRKAMESPVEGRTDIVAVLDGHTVGTAGLLQGKGRRGHVGNLFMPVHDDHCGRGIGTALAAALIDAADNWLNLKCLELTVYVDNKPAIRL